MAKTNTQQRLDKLETSLAALTATLTTLAQHIQGGQTTATPTTPTTAPTTPTTAPTTPTTAPTEPSWARPGWKAQALDIKVTPRRQAPPPLPQRPTPIAAPATGATSAAQAHSMAADDKCFLGCRTQRGHASRPSTGLIELASGSYWHKGEGDGTRSDPRPGALNAHAQAGTTWPAVNDATGQTCMLSAQAILQALKAMRLEDGAGNRGAPAVLVGEEPINGWRLSPAPFRRATLAEKMASDENAYRRLVALAAEATAARKRMGLA